MSFLDNIRRRFAVTGSNPAFKKDEPRSFGAGVIKRIKLTNNSFTGNDYENILVTLKHI